MVLRSTPILDFLSKFIDFKFSGRELSVTAIPMVKNYMRKLLYFDNQWHVHYKQSSCLPLILVYWMVLWCTTHFQFVFIDFKSVQWEKTSAKEILSSGRCRWNSFKLGSFVLYDNCEGAATTWADWLMNAYVKLNVTPSTSHGFQLSSLCNNGKWVGKLFIRFRNLDITSPEEFTTFLNIPNIVQTKAASAMVFL